MALLPPDPVYTIRNVDNVPVYSLAFSFLPGGLERLLAGSKNGYVYAYNLQVSTTIGHTDDVVYIHAQLSRENSGDVSYGFRLLRRISLFTTPILWPRKILGQTIRQNKWLSNK